MSLVHGLIGGFVLTVLGLGLWIRWLIGGARVVHTDLYGPEEGSTHAHVLNNPVHQGPNAQGVSGSKILSHDHTK